MQTFEIKSASGLSVLLSDYGARIVDITVPIQGRPVSVVYRHAKLADYATDTFYMGATIGPIANRIANGQLEIAEQSYQLHRNHGQHCLHGGTANFDKALWQVTEQSQDSVLFELNYAEDTSALPGNLSVSARFSVANNSLEIEYTVTTDKATYVNLTNHLYLNLNGACEPIQNHQFSLYADGFLQADQDSIPTGNITAVENPLQYSLVDQSPYAQINHAADSHFVLNNPQTHNKLARAYSPLSKISAEVSSSKAGFQFYTGQFLAEPCQPFGGFCVEPQFAPNAINQTEFASPLTTPDKPYLHKIRFDFAWP